MATAQITAEPGVPQIAITREFLAPRELVFRAYADPELLVQWLGPRRLAMRIDRYELRDGGRYRFVHTDADGTEYGFHGVFHGTQSPDGMVRTFEFEGAPGRISLETATFEEREGTTLVRANAVYQSVEDRDGMMASGMAEGVNEGFERLEELLARMTSASW